MRAKCQRLHRRLSYSAPLALDLPVRPTFEAKLCAESVQRQGTVRYEDVLKRCVIAKKPQQKVSSPRCSAKKLFKSARLIHRFDSTRPDRRLHPQLTRQTSWHQCRACVINRPPCRG